MCTGVHSLRWEGFGRVSLVDLETAGAGRLVLAGGESRFWTQVRWSCFSDC